jgi:hypothetical protein
MVGAAGALAVLGFVALAAARHAAGLFATARRVIPASLPGTPEAAVVAGVAEPLLSQAQAAADDVTGSAGDKAAAIRRLFPCIADVAVRHSWGDASATLTPALRRAIAAALRRGRSAGYLSEDGAVFSAPDGMYETSGPRADVGDADPVALRALAREWPALSASEAFPTALAEMSWVSGSGEDASWQARLSDGTTVQWGRLAWTKEKLARLSEAMADARAKVPGAFAADLRWFEDGKVLLKPVGSAVAAGNKGGVR